MEAVRLSERCVSATRLKGVMTQKTAVWACSAVLLPSDFLELKEFLYKI
jgi:hypothetical protein